MGIDASSTLSCSALTSYSAVKNARIIPDDTVVSVCAGGGLGLMAIRIIKAISDARVIALDVNHDKLKVAKDNVADVIINSKKEGEDDIRR